MRKPKPRKAIEAKPNEIKEIPVTTWDPSKVRMWQATVFVTILAKMEEMLKEHREIWRECCRNGGYLRHKYKLKMTSCIKGCEAIRIQYAKKGVEPTPFAVLEMEKIMRSIREEDMARKNLVGKQPVESRLYKEDESLPGKERFYETVLGAWGCSVMLTEKMTSFAKSEGILRELEECLASLIQYLQIVDKTIVRNVDDLPSSKEKAKLFKKVPAWKIETIHEELRKKGYEI